VKIDSVIVLSFFAVIVLTVLYSFLWDTVSDREGQEQTKDDINTNDEHDESEIQRRFRSIVIRSVDKISKEIRRANNEEAPNNKTEKRLKKLEIAGLFLAAGVGFVAVLGSALDSSEQRDVMQRQLDTMEANQRPWADVEIGTLPFPPVDLREEGVAAVPMELTIINIGHSPMFNTRSRSWGFIAGVSGIDPISTWKRDCDTFRGERGSGWDKGSFLFPGGKDSNADKRSGIIPGIGSSSVLKGIKPRPDGKRSIAVYVYGCVNYSFSESGENHQTRFLVEMYRARSGGRFPNLDLDPQFEVGEIVQPYEIKFLPGPTGGIDAD
jgi:hypothetical protein